MRMWGRDRRVREKGVSRVSEGRGGVRGDNGEE